MWLSLLLTIVGGALAVAGVALVSVPAALIVGGVGLIAYGLFVDSDVFGK
jgi:uncharacterized membrane-anchored protein YitT (DUF2179 family)